MRVDRELVAIRLQGQLDRDRLKSKPNKMKQTAEENESTRN